MAPLHAHFTRQTVTGAPRLCSPPI
jgi:hypothetical protein